MIAYSLEVDNLLIRVCGLCDGLLGRVDAGRWLVLSCGIDLRHRYLTKEAIRADQIDAMFKHFQMGIIIYLYKCMISRTMQYIPDVRLTSIIMVQTLLQCRQGPPCLRMLA
jgi:hypothetical protein